MFEQLLQCEWPKPTDAEIAASQAVDEYDRRCDSFDKAACGLLEPFERVWSEMNRNALEVKQDVIQKFGITNDEFQVAIKRKRGTEK